MLDWSAQGHSQTSCCKSPFQNNLPNKYTTHFLKGCYETLVQSCLLTWTLRSIFCLFEGQARPKRLQIPKYFDFYYPEAWEVMSFFFLCDEFSPYCENYFEKNKLCHEFPVLKKRSPKKTILFRKLPQLLTNMGRVLKISYFHILKIAKIG